MGRRMLSGALLLPRNPARPLAGLWMHKMAVFVILSALPRSRAVANPFLALSFFSTETAR